MAGAEAQSPEEIYAILRRAVLARQSIAGVYDGRARWLCPHLLGWNQQGQPRVLCYQYGGDSARGLDPDLSRNWRCMSVTKFRRVDAVDAPWTTGPNYSRPHPCVSQVDVAVGVPRGGEEPQNGQ